MYKKKKKKKIYIQRSEVYCLHSYFNKSNIIVTLTNLRGNTILWFSCGSIGLKGYKKGTLLAAQKLSNFISNKLKKLTIKSLILITRGFGKLKTIFIKNIIDSNIKIKKCVDVTAIPFNGCRPKKKRKI